MLHHCIPLPKLERACKKTDAILIPNPKEVKTGHPTDDIFLNAYQWWETHLGYYPLFLSVGETKYALQLTGYQNQWTKKPENPNLVLFTFPVSILEEKTIQANFHFFDYWEMLLNLWTLPKSEQPTEKWIRKRMLPKMPMENWLGLTKKGFAIQLCLSRLALHTSQLIQVRNKTTKVMLQNLGFNQEIRVERLSTRLEP